MKERGYLSTIYFFRYINGPGTRFFFLNDVPWKVRREGGGGGEGRGGGYWNCLSCLFWGGMYFFLSFIDFFMLFLFLLFRSPSLE